MECKYTKIIRLVLEKSATDWLPPSDCHDVRCYWGSEEQAYVGKNVGGRGGAGGRYVRGAIKGGFVRYAGRICKESFL